MKLAKSLVNLIRKISGQQKIEQEVQSLRKQAEELRYAQLFHDATIDSKWYVHRNLALGSAAIYYGTAYVIFRVLNQMHPKDCLEFGVGQSSKIIHQYANYYSVFALTIEHSEDWNRFFSDDLAGKFPVRVKIVDLEEAQYYGSKTLTYHRIDEALGGLKYDFVFVDGPFGFNHDTNLPYKYSRTQIFDVCKNHLKDSFCIIMHDSEREGEQNTIEQVCKILEDNHLEYYTKEYMAAKNCFLICSKDMYFLTTL